MNARGKPGRARKKRKKLRLEEFYLLVECSANFPSAPHTVAKKNACLLIVNLILVTPGTVWFGFVEKMFMFA